MKQHPLSDETVEFNSRCQKCANGIFNQDKGGRKIFKIGRCSLKEKRLVSTIQIMSFECDLFKKLT